MLNTLLENGKKIGLFEVKKLEDLDTQNRISSKVEVIDFDAVKDNIFKTFNQHEFGFNSLKSCDAVKIIPNENRLDFIEIKGIEEFVERHSQMEIAAAIVGIDEQIEKFNLPNKIFHSLTILTIVFQIDKITLTNAQKNSFFDEVISDFIIVIDSEIEQDGIKSFEVMLEFLAETSNIKEEYIIRLEQVINGISILKIQKPLLKYNSEIDNHYYLNMQQ